MLSALELVRQIETGALTARAVIDRCAEAIAKREADIGAFVTLAIEAARERADELATLPLRGLPIGVKDIYDTADLPTQYGSAIYAGHRPKADAAMVALIRRAGGVVIGKTVTTEFAGLAPAGTRNPHNLAHTPGGSSSGSAAAVAAGMLPIALGSQTGGSVIRPAAFCGVVGFKPSFRLMPTIGMKCFSWSLDTVGLFAAGVADAAFAAALISGRDLRIDSTEPAAPRIALVRTQFWPEASASMQDAIARAAHAAEAAGAKVTEVELPPRPTVQSRIMKPTRRSPTRSIATATSSAQSCASSSTRRRQLRPRPMMTRVVSLGRRGAHLSTSWKASTYS